MTKNIDKTTPPKSTLQSEKLQAIKVAMEQIDKQFGTGSIMKLGTSTHMDIDCIPTSALALDLALGIGGFPRGRITEIYGGTAAFIDAEHALDPSRAKAVGVNLDELLISQPDTGEQALEIAETLIRSGAIDVIVVDSVAAPVPKAEIEGEIGDAVMGMQARLMSQALRKLTGAISKSKAAMIFTNQLRMKIGVMFGNPETTTGGQALKFYSSVRIDMRKIGNITEGETIIGSRHRAKIVKNKVAPPFKLAEFDIMTTGGISRSGGVLDIAVEHEIIEKSGSFFKYKGEMLAQGREATKVILEERPELMKKLEKEIWDKIKTTEKAS